MSGSVICPACKGNGYIGSSKETDTQTDCHVCKNQGCLDLNTAEDLEMDSCVMYGMKFGVTYNLI
jgi:hypothetical protein